MKKRIHGGSLELWEKRNLEPMPPVPCDFKIGDKVIFTNDYGIKFNCVVFAFAKDDSFYGRFIHIIRDDGRNGDGDAWWFPHAPKELTLNN